MSTRTRLRVIVGMSGGVDSSVAALLLQQQGYDVHGLYMYNWEEDDQAYCTAADDFQDASAVCERLNIPLHQVSFAAEYRTEVFDKFLAGLKSGYTPNPDVLCNREIKFGTFLKHAKRLGADLVATGHYARVAHIAGEHRLLQAVDQNKDQSYFLHLVPATALAQTFFPLGELHKSEVRQIAQEAGLQNARKRDSTGICFIGERPFREFLQEYLSCEPGDIRTPDGRRIGAHVGLPFYTLGQRQGLGIGGVRGADNEPWYVAQKDFERNALIVVQGRNDPLLYSASLRTGPVYWINRPPGPGFRCQVSTRYRQSPAHAVMTKVDETGSQIDFDQPQWAVTPGQYAVVYDGEHCLGGGEILANTAAHIRKTAV